MTITETTRGYELQFDFRPNIVKELKAIPGTRFQGKERGWFVPHVGERKNPDNTTTKFVNKEPMEKFKAKYTTMAAGADNPEVIYTIKNLPELTIDIPLNPPFGLYPYQAQGVARGMELESFINADQPGLGKTLQSVATVLGWEIERKDVFPVLVICPSALKENWRREWQEKFSNKKAVILDDSNKSNWHHYYNMRMGDVFIVNYESLKKFFLISTGTKGKEKPTLKSMIFNMVKDVPKTIILDEAHKCFPYETPILTNKGWLSIGDICENKTPDLFAMSCNLSTNELSLKKITNHWINGLSNRKLFKITTTTGIIYCTGNHIIYTTAGPKEALSLRSGDMLFKLQEGFYNKEGRQDNSQILFDGMQENTCIKFGRIQGETSGRSQEGRASEKELSMVWQGIHTEKQFLSSDKGPVLWAQLFGEMENEPAGNESACRNSRTKGELQAIGYKEHGQTGDKKDAFRSNEGQQSNEKSGNVSQDGSIKYRENILESRGQWEVNCTSNQSLQGIESSRGVYGACDNHSASKTSVSVVTTSLQSGYRDSGDIAGYRGGWQQSQYKKMEISGQKENGCIELVRVESCEVYEPTSPGEFGYSSIRNQRVYDIEVEDNHNYFANGFLVSNCKDVSTLQAKIIKGITTGKKHVIALTGTPVVNRSSDLISILAIINKLHLFGGYKFFMDRYCKTGKNVDNHYNELNGKLNEICFFRREKKEVLKDLPDKSRTKAICDISTRNEYNEAVHTFQKYLTDNGYTAKEIDKKLKAEVLVKIGLLKKLSAVGKMQEVYEYVDDLIECDEKIVLFIHSREVAELLMKKYPNAVTVRGADNAEAKQNSVDAFQTNPAVKLIIVSIKAGGVGLTLTAASNVGFVELPWHDADCDQCESRCHRIGVKSAVTATYFLGKDTIDEKIYQIIEEKRKTSSAITGSTDNIDTIIDDLTRNLFNQKTR